MAGSYVDFFEGIDESILFVFDFEYLSILSSAELVQNFVIPEATAVLHMSMHFLFYWDIDIKLISLKSYKG